MHATGIEFYDSLFVREAAEPDSVVVRIIFGAFHDAEGGVERVAAAFRTRNVVKIFDAVIGAAMIGRFADDVAEVVAVDVAQVLLALCSFRSDAFSVVARDATTADSMNPRRVMDMISPCFKLASITWPMSTNYSHIPVNPLECWYHVQIVRRGTITSSDEKTSTQGRSSRGTTRRRPTRSAICSLLAAGCRPL
jgi:hypothetical protein